MYFIFMTLIVIIMIIVCYYTTKKNDNSGSSNGSHDKVLPKISKILSYITGILVVVLLIVLLVSPLFKTNSKNREGHHCLVCGKTASMQLDGAYFCYNHYNAYLHDNW